jgi:hypothetical protein
VLAELRAVIEVIAGATISALARLRRFDPPFCDFRKASN